MIEDLVAMLDRAWSALAAEEPLDFPVNLFRFHDLLAHDPRTNELLNELRADEMASKTKLDAVHREAATMVTGVVDQLEQSAAQHFDPEPEDEGDIDTSLGQIRSWIEQAMTRDPDPFLVGKERTDGNKLSNAIEVVDEVSKRAGRPDLRAILRTAKRLFEHSNRERRLFYLTSAGTALVMLERHLDDFHPPAIDRGEASELAHLARTHNSPVGRLVETIFGAGRIDLETDLQAAVFLDGMRADARRVYEHVRARIGAELSLRAVFERYRQRSAWYDAERLRAIARSGAGKPEDRLTETLAAYLFDHGLNPLTRPLVGKVQPDVLGVGAKFSFYVEAKQYTDGAATYLRKGMQQVWDMLDEIRGSSLDVAEAFYVVYRRGGPRYSFPCA